MKPIAAHIDEPDQSLIVQVEQDGEDAYIALLMFLEHIGKDPDEVALLSPCAAERLGKALIRAAKQAKDCA